MCSDNVGDIFENASWNYDAYAKECQRKWSVTPRPNMAEIIYGGRDISAASNIVFRLAHPSISSS